MDVEGWESHFRDYVDLVITCRLGMEKVVASYIAELDPEAKVIPSPYGYMGLVLVARARDKSRLYSTVRERVPEVEKAFLVEKVCLADINELTSCVKDLVSRISKDEKFAVHTVRRGEHSFRSLDVNVAVGTVLKELSGASVDLENPDKVFVIQIVRDRAYISVVSGGEFRKKLSPYKFPMYKFFRKLVVAHEPYLGPPTASYTMGLRVGREVQTYEVGKLIVTPISLVEAAPLYHFLRGLFEGIESRYAIQKKSYGREVSKVRVLLQDMYQFVRSRMGKPLIIFEPEGEPLSRIGDELSEFIMQNVRKGNEIALMVGAREGVPTGLFRYANYVVDLVPGVVISTEYALASALVALANVVHEKLLKNGDAQHALEERNA